MSGEEKGNQKNSFFNVNEDGAPATPQDLSLESLMKMELLSRLRAEPPPESQPSFFEKNGKLLIGVFSPFVVIFIFLLGGYSNFIKGGLEVETMTADQMELKGVQDKQNARVRSTELNIVELRTGQAQIKKDLADLKTGVDSVEGKFDDFLKNLINKAP